jgi:hypothetical protein
MENDKQRASKREKLKNNLCSLRPSPSGCQEKRGGGRIHIGYLADGTSHAMQSSESVVERHRKMKYDIDQYYEAVLGLIREAGKVRT